MSARRLASVLVLTSALASSASAQTATSNDAKVQPPEIKAPERASLVGQLASVLFGPADVGRGAFTLPSPFIAPMERGAPLASPFPSYSPESGISEWGAGWQARMAIVRMRVHGDIDYANDDLESPFGRLQRGADGNWYPTGLAALVRVTESGDTLTAHMPDGARLVFGGAARVLTSRGTYTWYLTEAISVTGRKTRIDWIANPSGRMFAKSVWYGGVESDPQYQIELAYESLPLPFEDYRSGQLLTLDRRVKTVTVRAKQARTGVFEERWRYDLGYLEEGFGPAFYLATVQQVFRGGERLPATTYTYHLAAERLSTAQLLGAPRIDQLLATASLDVLHPSKSTPFDANDDGTPDLEWAYDYRLLRQTPSGFTAEALPAAPGAYVRCRRPGASTSNPPRTLSQFRSGAGDETQYVIDLAWDGYGTTTFSACNRTGERVGTAAVAQNWALGSTVRLVDVNRDHKPDLVRVAYGRYLVLPNTSTATTFSFGTATSGTLSPAFTPDTAWVHDFNGDGLPDLIGRYSGGLVVWFGKGNLEFATGGRSFTLRTQGGSVITSLSSYALAFVDANKDGLTDVVLSSGSYTALFMNRGTHFQETTVPGLRSVDMYMSKPLMLDTQASGDTEVVFTKSRQGWAVKLDGPETGLMASADDGKGTVLSFAYARAASAPGARKRQAVLSALTVRSSGRADVTYEYDYASPHVHTEGKFLVGYDLVDRRYGDVGDGVSLGTTRTRFKNADHYAGLPEESASRDAYAPGIEKFTKTKYQGATYQGLPWLRVEEQESGWRTVDADPLVVRETVRYLEYERDEYCPSLIERETAAGVLHQAKLYASLPAFARSLACLEEGVTTYGTHADRRLDFTYETFVARNGAGQVTQVASGGGGELWVLQDVSYDALWRVQRVSSPGKGTTKIAYDPVTGLAASVTAPTGVVTSAIERDWVTDALKHLRTDRGALVHEQWFRYDGQERLARAWDSLGSANEFNPDSTLSYRYATATTPASVTTTTLVSAPSSVRTTMDLLTAKGEAIGTAAQIPEGWAMGRITYRDPSAGHATSYTQRTFAPSLDPGLLSLPMLFEGADWVADARAGEFGVGMTTTRLHADVQLEVADVLGIDPGRLVRSTTENGTFTQTHTSDAAGKVAGYWNEVGTAWGYVHDALGRLREVQLPDGTSHRLSFDAHGRVSQVARDGIATIDYSYEPVTGLPREKRFTGNTGVLRRKVTTTYDAIGRVSVERHEDVTTGESRSFHFTYDGGSQLGLLTQVIGEGFEKELTYEADASLASRVLTLAGGWRRIDTTLKYNEARELQSQSTVVKDSKGAVVASSSTRHDYDPYGRSAATSLGTSTLASYTYDANGLLSTAALAGGNSVTLTYDRLTRAVVGTSQLSAGTVSSVDRRFNSRGVVDHDDLVVGATSLRRSYAYTDERFLASSVDARSTSSYVYSPSGLPTAITENRVPVQISTDEDDLGRTIVRDDLRLSYGPDGQLSSATRGSVTWTYIHDEDGQRLLKYRDGSPVAAYPEEGFLDATGFTQPVKLAGRTVGLLVNGTFEPRSTDLLGSPIADLNGAARIASPYGSRWLDGHPDRSAALDYVEKGFDADLGLVRMGVRDYDPQLAVFTTPDPLFTEAPALCLRSPAECSLYSYAASNPLIGTDPTGTIVETAWDGMNVAFGAVSLAGNIREGKWGWAALDAAGLLYDGFATAVPFLPAGAGATIKAAKAGTKAATVAVKHGGKLADAANVGVDVGKAVLKSDDAARSANLAANAAQEGTKLHRQVGEALKDQLSDQAENFFKGANKATGKRPDLAWKNVPGVWADLTTPGQWASHVNKYAGEGIPILYGRGVGVLIDPKLPTFMGSGLFLTQTGLEAVQSPRAAGPQDEERVCR